jgi:hypothetical protein
LTHVNLLPVRMPKVETPERTTLSRPCFNLLADGLSPNLEKAPENLDEARRQVCCLFSCSDCIIDSIQAIVRDGYRCMITRKYDYDVYREHVDKGLAEPDCNEDVDFTHCTYIIPPSMAGMMSNGPSADATVIAPVPVSGLTVLGRASCSCETEPLHSQCLDSCCELWRP